MPHSPEPVPAEYGFLDGVVTYRAADPLAPSQDGYGDEDRLAIVGLLPDDDAPRRVLLMLADPGRSDRTAWKPRLPPMLRRWRGQSAPTRTSRRPLQ